MDEMTLANIPESVGDLCYKCQQPMLDEEPCNMTWNCEAESHIVCPHLDKNKA